MIVENLTFYSKRLKQLIAYTVMPDHVHVMVYVETVAQLSGFLRDFKKRTSKEIKRLLDIDVPHIWQQGTMDHCIRLTPENQDYINHLHYIFYNSVKHLGIVPKSFAFHNFTEAVGKGWIAEDFCAAPPEFPAVFESYEKNQHGDVESESD
jgi:REP element-mobilizing transposase RayT